jgi:hypothetical protein
MNSPSHRKHIASILQSPTGWVRQRQRYSHVCKAVKFYFNFSIYFYKMNEHWTSFCSTQFRYVFVSLQTNKGLWLRSLHSTPKQSRMRCEGAVEFPLSSREFSFLTKRAPSVTRIMVCRTNFWLHAQLPRYYSPRHSRLTLAPPPFCAKGF